MTVFYDAAPFKGVGVGVGVVAGSHNHFSLNGQVYLNIPDT